MVNGRAQIVILGGGIGGLVAATKLGRSLGAKHDVILIDRRDEHIFTPSFLFLMLGQRRPEDLKRKLQILERRKVKVMQAEILDIDVKLGGGSSGVVAVYLIRYEAPSPL